MSVGWTRVDSREIEKTCRSGSSKSCVLSLIIGLSTDFAANLANRRESEKKDSFVF
jgi:hypothetical protein